MCNTSNFRSNSKNILYNALFIEKIRAEKRSPALKKNLEIFEQDRTKRRKES